MRASKLDVAYKRRKRCKYKGKNTTCKTCVRRQTDSSKCSKRIKQMKSMGLQMVHRFDKDGLDGLKDKERSGRPPDVPKEYMIKIKQELRKTAKQDGISDR